MAYSELPREIGIFGGSIDFSTLLAFAAASLVFAASLGPDNVTIIARTISNVRGLGHRLWGGTTVGTLIFPMIAAFALSIIPTATGGGSFTILRKI
ncbi:hypothetical protein [Agrobacterium rubi]|uniref:hypothetical protein n=1 Tax=Agrobacterium rubi TaxID=28099 RepID=UPI00201B8D39|nr:hypothetical protein [Agrobacterium rubi]